MLNGVNTPYGYAALQHCGRINTTKLISSYKASIQSNFSEAPFDYAALESGADGVRYKVLRLSISFFARATPW